MSTGKSGAGAVSGEAPGGRAVRGGHPPGAVAALEGEIELNAGRPFVDLEVSNTGDRPIQVGSHFHFFEANRALAFDRAKAFGYRLDVPAGSAVRFEPGETKRVRLVAISGFRRVEGLNRLTEGSLDGAHVRRAALERAARLGFSNARRDGS